MTFFSESNGDDYAADEQEALGPRVHFQQQFKNSYDAQVRASAQFGIERAMFDLDQAQVKRMRDAGLENVPYLTQMAEGFSEGRIEGDNVALPFYLDTARFYSKGGTPEMAEQLSAFDSKIEELRKTHPDLNLMTASEMFDDVRTKAQEAERRYDQARTTTGGSIGGFVGGAIASMDPRTDPLNFATLGVGGVGKTAVARIATEGVAQGAIEAINQFTGVQEERDLLGLSHGFQDAVYRVAGTAVFGSAIQGVGEGLVAGGRRFFRNTPSDPAPPPPEPRQPIDMTNPLDLPGDRMADSLAMGRINYDEVVHSVSPLSNTRAGRTRSMIDLDHVTQRLNDWHGEAPHEIKPPRTATFIPDPVSGVKIERAFEIDPSRSIDAVARDTDPQLFARYDKLVRQKETASAWLQQNVGKDNFIAQSTQDLTDRIDALTDQINDIKVGARKRKELEQQRDTLRQERQSAVDELAKTDTPSQARVRRDMLAVDEKMRDMAPLLGRAYAAAKDKWDLGAADRARVNQMVRKNLRELPDQIGDKVDISDLVDQPDYIIRALSDKAPILREAWKVEGKVKADADAADIASAIVKENMKVMDEAMNTYRTSISKVLSENGDGTISINGTDFKFDLDNDKVIVPQEEGSGGREISVRQFLEEQAEFEADLKAVQTCSLR